MSKQKYPQSETVSSSGEKVVRKGREHYSHAKADARKNKRRDEAEDRQANYDALTTKEKLKGLGATGSNRQRKRLEALLAKESPAVPKQTPKQKNVKAVKATATK